MKVVAVGNEFPLPVDRGGPVRFLGLMKALAAAHDVRLLVLTRPDTTQELVDELQSMLGVPVGAFGRPPVRGGSIGRWGEAIAGGMPPWIREQYSPDLERKAVELAQDADAVVLLDDYAGVYAQALAPLAPVIADKPDVMGWTASAARPASNGARDRVMGALVPRLVRRFEGGYAQHAAAIVVTSEDESDRFEQLYGRRPDAVVPSAIDLPAASAAGQPRTVGWLGTHNYAANVEGLLRFVNEGWEPLGADGYRLRIAGGDPSAEVRALERYPGVEVLGYVDALDDFLDGVHAAVIPLWWGPGVKLKTLTFMGAGVPAAATPVAVEGTGSEHGRHCMVADSPGGLAEALRAICTDDALAQRLGSEARRLVSERYTWDSVGARFVEVVERTADRAS